jgi:hypothetical protein
VPVFFFSRSTHVNVTQDAEPFLLQGTDDMCKRIIETSLRRPAKTILRIHFILHYWDVSILP